MASLKREVRADQLVIGLASSTAISRGLIEALVAKHCGDSSASRDEAIERMQGLLAELPQLLASVGAKGKRGGR